MHIGNLSNIIIIMTLAYPPINLILLVLTKVCYNLSETACVQLKRSGCLGMRLSIIGINRNSFENFRATELQVLVGNQTLSQRLHYNNYYYGLVKDLPITWCPL